MKQFRLIFTAILCATCFGFTNCAPEEKDLGPKNDPAALENVVGKWETGTETEKPGTSSNGGSVTIITETIHYFTFTEDYVFTEVNETKVKEGEELVDSSKDLTKGSFIVSSDKIVLTYTKGSSKKVREMSYERVKVMGKYGMDLTYTADNGTKVSKTFFNLELN